MTFRCVWSALIIAAALPGVAQQDTQPSEPQIILSLERAWAEAVRHNDNSVLDELFDNALVLTENGKTMTKGEYLSGVRARGPHAPQFKVEDMSVRMFDDTAIVVGIYTERTMLNGRPDLKRCRFIDTWLKKGDRWLLVAAGSSPLH